MNSWLVRPRWFAAHAAAAGALAPDPDLPKGTHVRLLPSAALGFPLAPFLLWPVEAFATEPVAMDWLAPDGHLLPGPDIDAAGGLLMGRRQPEPPSDSRLVGLEARFHGAAGEIALLDRSGLRVTAARSSSRWLVAAPEIFGVRLRGRGPVTVQGWVISAGRAIEAILGSPAFATLSLPLEGDRPWYAGGEGAEMAMRRVERGAPLRWPPTDRPDGPFDPLPPQAERQRIAATQADLDDDAERLVGDEAVPPAAVKRTHVWPGEVAADGQRRPWQRATEGVQDSLLMKALDAGAGRYIGLAGVLDDLLVPQDPFAPPGARGWLAAGLFAVGPDMRFQLPDPDAAELRLIERLQELQPGVRRPAELAVARHGLTLRALVATALAAPPPDLPAVPEIALGDAGWQREAAGPSTRFRQQLRVHSAPLVSCVALGRLEAGGWMTRHALVDLTAATPGADPAERAAPRLLGSTAPHRLLGSAATRESVRFGILADSDIPADGAPWTYRVSLADLFGRFGTPAELPVPTPQRPPVPAPVLQSQVSLADRAEGDGAAPAGTVRFTVAVPGLQEMTVGSRPLGRAVVTFDGTQRDAVTPPEGARLAFDFQLPALLPLEGRTLTATAFFEDDAGQAGPQASLDIKVQDPRSPPVPRTGIGIVWSSRPGPSQDVEFRLRFDGSPGARYRVYMADARALEVPLEAAGRLRSRAEVAVDGAGREHVGLRDRFRLLTDTPLQPGGDGKVSFDTRLPRALETVQFLRFVPLSAQGSEASFEACPLLPIAVPADRRPPAPRVEARVDPDTRKASIEVRAAGLDAVALRAAEPGLFDEPPAADAVAPEFRLRRSSGGVPDALYAREIHRGALARDGDDFVAALDDLPSPDGLLPYVRYHYWAEVRMPPERRVPAGVEEIALPVGAIVPQQPAQGLPAPGAFSSASAPAMALFVPAAVPQLRADQVTATVAAAEVPGHWRLTLSVAGGPQASPRAVGRFRVQLHVKLDDGDFAAEPADLPFEEGRLDTTLERSAPALPVMTLALVLVDPVGRAAEPLQVVALG